MVEDHEIWVELIEAGARAVTISFGFWDYHSSNYARVREDLPMFDQALSALIEDLHERGMADDVSVVAWGEFGRTPKINQRSAEGGRDHYPRCMFMLMAGGGVQGGQVIGESDDTASGPRHEAISPDDVAASFYYNLGIDPSTEFNSSTGRPITLVRDGSVLKQLFA